VPKLRCGPGGVWEAGWVAGVSEPRVRYWQGTLRVLMVWAFSSQAVQVRVGGRALEGRLMMRTKLLEVLMPSLHTVERMAVWVRVCLMWDMRWG
jgi:hypothetical protein